ncbi:NAD(P)H-binding protein [Tropicimonas sp. IMCC34043]|uniref:NmrA family NAD(P)-binding protein n=1 Tax=Tropicimonas sp. IMCC34043 TaxID=2248760 RepID=UPI000E27E813|nr:NAD(P)H-binding protein [Tropicimonas sp. IMCC34043]
MTTPRILVTGASGQLGTLVIDGLLAELPAADIAGLVRSEAAAKALQAKGVAARIGSYDDPASLDAAMTGIERVLLISGSEIGKRVPQHRNVIKAAVRAGVKGLAYTSILRADTSAMKLAVEHRETEALLAASGLPHVLLRNGWYVENYTGSIPTALAHGAHAGAAGEGRISAATRADYAAAAVKVLAATEFDAGAVLELAADEGFTLAEFAAELSQLAGRPVVYADMSEDAYRELLVGAGLPAGFADILADSDRQAADGSLKDNGKALSRLIGRPTTPWRDAVATAFAALQPA